MAGFQMLADLFKPKHGNMPIGDLVGEGQTREAPPEVKEMFKQEAKAEADAISGGDPRIWQQTFDRIYRNRMMNWRPDAQ